MKTSADVSESPHLFPLEQDEKSSYAALVKEFPLRRIKTLRDLARAERRLQSLDRRGSRDERDYREVLQLLIDTYREWCDAPTGMEPRVALIHMMKRRQCSRNELIAPLGTRQDVWRVLEGKRPITKAQAIKLAEHFKVSPAVFGWAP